MAFSATRWLLVFSAIMIYIFISTAKSGDAYYDPETTGLVVEEAIQCLDDQRIYTSCNEDCRLTQSGELNVRPEYADQYCNGPCLRETQLVLDCIDGILSYFEFYNKATIRDVRETIDQGCGHGPKRGEFDVAEHMRYVDEANANRVAYSVSLMMMMMMIMAYWYSILF